MIIKLIPVRMDDTLELFKSGDVLTVNGEEFDFSQVGEGDTLPASAITCKFFFGEVARVNGELILSMQLPNPWNYSQEQAFPADLVDVPDGHVLLPQPLPESVGVIDEY